MAQSLRMVAGAVGEVHAKFVRANFVTVAMSGLSDFFEPGGAAVRAYERNGLTFSLNADGDLVDDVGDTWQLTEDALIAEDGRQLERVAGHLAFWFGWYGFYPETDLYTLEVE